MRGLSDALVGALIVVLLLAPALRAEDATPSDPFGALSGRTADGPITIKADSLELDYREAMLTYVGSVQVTQGDMVLTSDRLAIAFHQGALGGLPKEAEEPEEAEAPSSDERIKEIVADGNVRITQGERVATGDRAVFDHGAQTIVLSDNAVLEEGPNKVSGERIVVYLEEQRSVVESGTKSRVQAVLYPDSIDVDEDDLAEAPPPAAEDDDAPATIADSRRRAPDAEGAP